MCSRVVFLALGDTTILKRVTPLIEDKKNATFQETVSMIRDADLVMSNCDMVLSDKGVAIEKGITVRSSPDVAEDMSQIGIDVVSLANNHVLDYGYESFFETMENLNRYNIKYFGVGRNLKESLTPRIVNVKDLRVAFLGFSSVLPLGWASDENRPGVAGLHVKTSYEVNLLFLQEEPGTQPLVRTAPVEKDLQYLEERIREAKGEADVVVVVPHWGCGLHDELVEYQQNVAHRLVDFGADFIIGYHPHVIQPVEIYRGKPIFYCMGNFFLHLREEWRKQWVLPEEVWNKLVAADAFTARITFLDKKTSEIEVIPIKLDEKNNPYSPPKDVKKRILDYVKKISEPFGTKIILEEYRGILGVD